MIYPITPVSKPRQTQRDKWQKRPAVMRYRAFADECRMRKVTLPEFGAWIVFHIPMPATWTKKKKAEMNGRPHKQKPDADNLAKALMDAVHKDDSVVWDIRATKVWAEQGAIEVRSSEPYSAQSHFGESKLVQRQAS